MIIMAMHRRSLVAHHQLVTCCALMLLLFARPVAPASRGFMPPDSAPTAAPAPTSPASAPSAAPAATSPAPAPALGPAIPTAPAPALGPAIPTTTPPAPAPTPLIWNVEYILWAPDCKQHGMIGINGEFPGPTITARKGDRIVVVVNNHLHTEGVVIHWHGIRQIGTPWADGTASISQCAINPGESFTYEFMADKPGTFFYHGHFGMQRAAGLYGSLIVNVPEGETEPFPYDGEHNMLLSDWYHEAVYAQVAGLDQKRKDKRFQWIGEPQTILINGSGQFDCTLGDVGAFEKGILSNAKKCDATDGKKMEAACAEDCGAEGKKAEAACMAKDCSGKRGSEEAKACAEECGRKAAMASEVCEKSCETIRRGECGPFCKDTKCGPVVYVVEPGKTYRLRIASTTSISALNVQVQGHKLKVVEADGNYVDPFEVDDIDIYSGESYSVLLETNKDDQGGLYWISVGVAGKRPKTLPALAILKYSNSDDSIPTGTPPETPDWQKANADHSKKFAKRINASTGTAKVPPSSPTGQPPIHLLNTQDGHGHLKWAINHVSLALPGTPYLGAYYAGIEGDVFDTTGEAPREFNPHYDIYKPPQKQIGEANISATVGNRVYRLAYGAVADVVIQNAIMQREGMSEAHPWHLHGHDFWVLGYGGGLYNHTTNASSLNTVNPPLRNTVVVFPLGWTAIRFVADNPGVWAFHCHIEPHLHLGMGVIFAEGTERLHQLEEKVPMEAFRCGVLSKPATLAPAAAPLGPAASPPAP